MLFKVPIEFFSTESALLKVTNDMLLKLMLRKSTFYIGLVLSAAFVTLDPEIFLSILEVSLGFRRFAVCFLKSYLSGRSHSVLIKDVLCSEREIKTGKSGFGFRPPTFSIYLLPLDLKFKQLQINYHFFGDDTVIFFVYEETVTQEKFDLIISSLEKRFSGTNRS